MAFGIVPAFHDDFACRLTHCDVFCCVFAVIDFVTKTPWDDVGSSLTVWSGVGVFGCKFFCTNFSIVFQIHISDDSFLSGFCSVLVDHVVAFIDIYIFSAVVDPDYAGCGFAIFCSCIDRGQS